MKDRLWPLLVLIILGAGWGLTLPLAKVAVSEGYKPLGLIFWQFTIGAVLLTGISLVKGLRLPFGRSQLAFYIVIALIGTLLPNSASYQAAGHLPAGVISILISFVPMFAFPIALIMAIDRFSWRRFFGLSFGMLGVAVLLGPQTSLPDRSAIIYIPIALIAPLFYAIESNVVSKWGTFGCSPIQVLLGAEIIGAILTAPLAVSAGQWISPFPPWGAPDYALVLTAMVHALAYTGYVWLVGKAGAVFAAQVAYLVTAFGVVWSMLLLTETYSPYVWLALALIFVGLFMVAPARKDPLVALAPVGDDRL